MKNTCLYAFVILHYNVLKETLTCVESIKENVSVSDYKMIIVDNASPNNTGKELAKLFAGDCLVKVILNEKNLGFACGNNVGISYARDILNADFVIVLNNDTYLIQKDFTQIIEAEWQNSHFAVLGPRVFTPTNIKQNPVPFEINNLGAVNNRLIKYRIAYLRALFNVDKLYFVVKQKIKKNLHCRKSVIVENAENKDKRQEKVKLHGCCLVFSPNFFEFFDGFDSKTFMYLEEDILIAHIRQKGLLSVYNPDLLIYHAEMAATKSLSESTRKKQLFVYGEYIKSLKVLKKFMLKW